MQDVPVIPSPTPQVINLPALRKVAIDTIVANETAMATNSPIPEPVLTQFVQAFNPYFVAQMIDMLEGFIKADITVHKAELITTPTAPHCHFGPN